MREITELLEFLTHQMTMAAIYQPVIILHLLERDGFSSRTELARTLSGYDGSDLSFWDTILMDAPKRTLANTHQIIIYDKANRTFLLNFDLKDAALVEKSKAICEEKIEKWIQKEAVNKGISEEEALRLYCVLESAKRGDQYTLPEADFAIEEFAVRSAVSEVHQLYPREKVTQQPYDNLGFDILVGTIEKAIAYVKVKATRSYTPSFSLSEGERRFSIEHSERFILSLVYQINLQTETYQIAFHRGVLDHQKIALAPMQWRCKFLSS